MRSVIAIPPVAWWTSVGPMVSLQCLTLKMEHSATVDQSTCGNFPGDVNCVCILVFSPA